MSAASVADGSGDPHLQWMVDGGIGIVTKAVEAMGLPPINWFESPGAATSPQLKCGIAKNGIPQSLRFGRWVCATSWRLFF